MVELLQIFVDNIAPILLVASAGFVVGQRYQIDPKPLSRLIFNIFSPALIFYSLATNEITLSELGQLFLVMALILGCMAGLAYLLTRSRESSRVERAGVILSAICPNNGNLGLPVISFAFGEEVLARAVVVYVATTILNYTAGVYIASSGRLSSREALLNVLRMPVVYAALFGLVINRLNIELPLVLGRSAQLLAQAAIPCMLILLGLQLVQSAKLEQARLVGVGVALRLVIAPLIALGFALLFFGMQNPASVAVIMQASMPVAVVTIIFATEFGLNSELQLNTIVATTLLSPITLSILILLLRPALDTAM